MNKVILMGRLTRDAEIRYSQGESATAIARFSLAVDRRFRRDGDDQNTDFINCVAWGKLGEAAGNLRKGSRCFVEGRLQTRSYETQDGQKRYVTEVVANFVGQSLDMNTNSFEGGSNFDSFSTGGDDENIPF